MLLTVGVAGFQLAVFFSILWAKTRGRWLCWTVATCWVIFTIIGPIYTEALRFLQLATIAVSLWISSGVAAPKRPQAPPVVDPPKKPESAAHTIAGIIGVAVVVFVAGLAWMDGDASRDPPKWTPPAPRPVAQGSVSTPAAVTPATSGSPPHTTVPKQPAREKGQDLRGCLALGTDAAIAKCASR